MANTNIFLNTLDPDTIKANFISFLQANSAFQDYNYSGSNINTLLDVLSRNTFMNSFFLNMVFSEMFNDSAQLRDSLVSKAKEMNYLPQSATSSTTQINVSLQAPGLFTFQIPKGTAFSGRNSNATYQFITHDNLTQVSGNGTYLFSNVNIFEGFLVSEVFAVDPTIPNQLFTLTNPGIDISSLSISVAENGGSTNNTFFEAPNLYGLGSNSLAYFLQAASGNTYQFQFGDGVVGYQPQSGAIISAIYRVCQGSDANFTNTFTLSSSLSTINGGSYSNVIITTVGGVTSGGSSPESVESIRFNNPRHFTTQGNAITTLDYRQLILENYLSIADVNVYGGGISNTGVNFGKVFVAAITQTGNPTTASLKSDVVNFLTKRNVINTPVQIVDPNYLYLTVNTSIYINSAQTSTTVNQFQTLAANTISLFSSNNLQKFNVEFQTSKLSSTIDAIDPSILGNDTRVTMKKKSGVVAYSNLSITVSMNNPVLSVNSSIFYQGGNTFYLTDTFNGVGNTGNIYLIQTIGSNTILANTVGTVNYANGIISINAINITGYPNNVANDVYFTAVPTSRAIFGIQNDIMTINSTDVSINVVMQ